MNMYNAPPDDEERVNMCEFINSTRKELNLEVYPSDFLARQSFDSIKSLHGRHVALRDNFESESGDGIKENMKLLALPGVFLVIMVVIVISVNISLNPQQQPGAEDYGAMFRDEGIAENRNGLPENDIFNYEISSNDTDADTESNQSGANLTEGEIFEISSFFAYGGSHSFIVQNTGTADLTFSSFSVDGDSISFEAFNGNYPIPSGESAYIRISKMCDGNEHMLEVVLSSGDESEFLMPSC